VPVGGTLLLSYNRTSWALPRAGDTPEIAPLTPVTGLSDNAST